MTNTVIEATKAAAQRALEHAILREKMAESRPHFRQFWLEVAQRELDRAAELEAVANQLARQ